MIPVERYQGQTPSPWAVYRAPFPGLGGMLPFEIGIASYEIRDLNALRSVEELAAYKDELLARRSELDEQYAGLPFPDDDRDEFAAAGETIGEIDSRVTELNARKAAILRDSQVAARSEQAAIYAVPNVIKTPDNIFDLAAYRNRVASIDELPAAYVDGAKRALDIASFPTQDRAKAQESVTRLLAGSRHLDGGAVAKRVLGTGSPVYLEAWSAYVAGGLQAVPPRLQAALQTYSDADGGFAIPFTIDPTFVLTSNGSVNPLREISRIEAITTKAWQAVTTAGVTASYVTEPTAASDDAPNDVDNPTITPARAHVFVGFTAEYQEDYGAAAIAAELGSMIQVAKDDLEANKFFLGTGTNQPDGIVARLVTDTTSLVPTITNDVFALADIDKLIGALPPRFRSRGKMTANLAILQLIPAFGTAGQPGNSVYDAVSKTLRGYSVYEASAMDDVATDAKKILLFGDFKHFVIVDRIGLSSEFIPQVFDGNGQPLGRRGIYARWRNSTGILTVNAFRLLKVQ